MADCCYKAHTHLSTVGTAFKHSSTSFFQSPLGEGGVCYTVCCLGLSPYKSVPSIVSQVLLFTICAHSLPGSAWDTTLQFTG